MSRQFSAVFLITMILGYTGCERRDAEDMEEVETTEDTMPGPPGEQVDSILGPGGGLVMTRNKKACMLVPESAIEGVADSVRITIRRSRFSSSDSTLLPPDSLPPAFRNAHNAGRRIFAPMYDFQAVALPADTAVKSFAKPIFLGLCVHGRPSELSGVSLAHPHPDSAETLEFFELVDLPCELSCRGSGAGSAHLETMERWLSGSPLTPTPAHARPAEGIGGKGDGPSPIAAVK